MKNKPYSYAMEMFRRVWVLYAIVAVAIFFSVDRKVIDMKITSYYQDVPGSMLRAAQAHTVVPRRDLVWALNYYKHLAHLAPSLGNVDISLGYAYAGLGETARALDQYTKALRQGPGIVGVRYNVACLYHRLGREEAAFRQLEELFSGDLQAAPSNGLGVTPEGLPLTTDTLKMLAIRVARLVAEGKNKAPGELKPMLDEFFREGLFYYALIRQVSVGGKPQAVIF